MSSEFVTADDGVRLAYERIAFDNGGRSVLLLHGFGSSRNQNWKSTGWFASLAEAGCRILAMDCRGHGMSDKPHDEHLYGHDRMARDAGLVMDAAGVADCDVVGYSMGGFIALRLAGQLPARVNSLSLGGVGAHYLTGAQVSCEGSRRMLSEALLAPDKNTIANPRGRMFRDFADQPGKDRIALAACMRAMSPPLSPSILSHVQKPVLVVCGEKDDISGPSEPLARTFPHGAAVTIAGRDHMSAVGDPRTRRAVINFLEL